MSRWAHDLVDVNVKILRSAGEPIRTGQINREAAKIFGNEWSDSAKRNLGYMRTALRELGILSHPKYGFWGLMPNANEKLAPLKDLVDDEVYKLYKP